MSSVVPKHLTIVERDTDRYYINEHLMIRTFYLKFIYKLARDLDYVCILY